MSTKKEQLPSQELPFKTLSIGGVFEAPIRVTGIQYLMPKWFPGISVNIFPSTELALSAPCCAGYLVEVNGYALGEAAIRYELDIAKNLKAAFPRSILIGFSNDNRIPLDLTQSDLAAYRPLLDLPHLATVTPYLDCMLPNKEGPGLDQIRERLLQLKQ